MSHDDKWSCEILLGFVNTPPNYYLDDRMDLIEVLYQQSYYT